MSGLHLRNGCRNMKLGRNIDHLPGFHFCVFPHPFKSKVKKICLRFHLNSETDQFKGLPFGSSGVHKGHKGSETNSTIKDIQQYLDNWSLRDPCQKTPTTYPHMCQDLGWMVNLKSELIPQQVFNFVGYHFDLSNGLAKSTQREVASPGSKY